MDEVKVLVLMREEEVALQQCGDDLMRRTRYAHTHGALESGALQALDFGAHGCGVEVGASSFTWYHFEDLVDDGAEVEVEEAVGFVEDEVFEVF